MYPYHLHVLLIFCVAKKVLDFPLDLTASNFDELSQKYTQNVNEPGHEKMCLMPYANNKGADQPAHPRSLISAFVVRCRQNDTSSLYIRNFKILAGLCS